MINIPETYYKNNEDYITIPAIKKFMKSHTDGKFKLNLTREELMKSIIEYGNKSDEKKEIVLSWIDDVIVEGIKDVYLTFLPVKNEAIKHSMEDDKSFIKLINLHLTPGMSSHICENKYGKDLLLISSDYSNTVFGKKITLVFCRKLFMHNKKEMHTKGIDYPIIAEYYIDSECLLVRAKPRTNLYEFCKDGFIIENAKSTTTEKQIKEVKERVVSILELDDVDKSFASEMLKSRIFKVLDKYTNTPKEIKDVMCSNQETINSVANSIMNICNSEEECNNVITQSKDVIADIENLIEKYLSVNWKNKDVFVKDRDAYPIKLSATDEEESKVEQTAALEAPLQTKALFFDNKKMLYKSSKCDGVVFQWKRNGDAMLEGHFTVRIHATPKGDCVFKFPKYTESEDINNVIFSIVNDETIS